MRNQTHIIHRRVLDFDISVQADADRLHDQDGEAFANRFADIESGVFDRLCNDGRTVTIDQMVIDLGIIGDDWSADKLAAHYRAMLEQELGQHDLPGMAGAARGTANSAHHLPPVLYFLETGHLPWWGAAIAAGPGSGAGVEALSGALTEICTNQPGLVRRWFGGARSAQPILERCYYQFGETLLLGLLDVVAPEVAMVARLLLGHTGVLHSRQSEPQYDVIVKAILTVAAQRAQASGMAFWAPFILALQRQGDRGAEAIWWLKTRLQDISPEGHNSLVVQQAWTALGVGALAEGAAVLPGQATPQPSPHTVANKAENQLSKAPDEGGATAAQKVPPMRVDSISDRAAINLAQEDARPDAALAQDRSAPHRVGDQAGTDPHLPHPQNPPQASADTGAARVPSQADTIGAKGGPAEAPLTGPEDQAPGQEPDPDTVTVSSTDTRPEIMVENAGLILLWPLLRGYFTRLGLMGDDGWLSDSAQLKAVHHLHYALSETVATPEYALPLTKLLCGLAPETPIPPLPDLAPWQQALAEDMMRAVLQLWPAMRGTSVDGLRSSFLVRGGLLSRHETGWRLRVEKEPFDMLLAQLPWPYRMVALSWMPEPLEVEW